MPGRTSWTCGFVAQCHIVIGYIAPGDGPVLSTIRWSQNLRKKKHYKWTECKGPIKKPLLLSEDSCGDWHPGINITMIIQYHFILMVEIRPTCQEMQCIPWCLAINTSQVQDFSHQQSCQVLEFSILYIAPWRCFSQRSKLRPEKSSEPSGEFPFMSLSL